MGRLSAHSSSLRRSMPTCSPPRTATAGFSRPWTRKNPFNSMARAYTELFIVRSDEAKETYIKNMLKFFKVDGIIYHDAKPAQQLQLPLRHAQRLEKQTGIPSLTITAT